MRLPQPAGPISGIVADAVSGTVAIDGGSLAAFAHLVGAVDDPVGSLDLQLALATCYELHYRGFDDVPDDCEWDPGVLALRAVLERCVLDSLAHLRPATLPPEETVPTLRRLVAQDGPALSPYLLRQADQAQFADYLAQRSIYHLKEADAHTWVIPRLFGRAKSALVEIQADEYGGGRPGATHAELFAQMMRELGLDDTYGAYWRRALPEMLAVVTLMSLFGLHRRWRGAAAGHLAALEMTSTGPSRRAGNGLRRLGYGPRATRFFDEHVEADAVHEQVAAVDLCGGVVQAEPSLAPDVVLGAAAYLEVEGRFAHALLREWGAAEDVELGSLRRRTA